MVVSPTFRTEVPIEPRTHRPLLRHDESLLLIGSCFSDGVGERLRAAGHDALSNPLGTLFNPASIRRAVELFGAPNLASPSQDGGGLWFNFDAGTALSRPTSADCDDAVALALAAGREQLQRSSLLCITLGSAWAYVDRESGSVVANCHKQNANRFERRLLGVDECADELRRCIAAARGVGGEDLRALVTVSPVRHWREGAVESSRSKAHLLSAAHEVIDSDDTADYFPSYEIVMDELRDYRWYDRDMLHPSDAAVDYVFEQLMKSHFSRDDDELRAAVLALTRAAAHRPLHPESDGAASFRAAQRRAADDLVARHPHVERTLAPLRASFE